MISLSPYELLNRKRKGIELDTDVIEKFVRDFARGEIPDYQMAAFLMAAAIHGLSPAETASLTKAMLESGEQWKLRDRFDFIADKHSTGGVGDKVSLIISPWIAACGVKIGMLSGRGLGHTGGTLDKLEAIPGFNARLERSEFEKCIEKVGCAISTSTAGIAPADRKMYSLRDVTGTVESIPLITGSIMSKKLAMGANALLLDVKTGSGAFMKSIEDARELARGLVSTAKAAGVRVEAMITSMDQPLGRAVGNANEVVECAEVLKGNGPHDIYEISRQQCIRTLVLSGRFDSGSAEAKVNEVFASGAALQRMREWIEAQGGDAAFIDSPDTLLKPRTTFDVVADRSGYLNAVETYNVGVFSVELGAGRMKVEDEVDVQAGLMIEKKIGDEVRAGDVLARVQLGRKEIDQAAAAERLASFFTIGDLPAHKPPLVYETVA
jgi:pyrimidine-nucleoside phosphorylase